MSKLSRKAPAEFLSFKLHGGSDQHKLSLNPTRRSPESLNQVTDTCISKPVLNKPVAVKPPECDVLLVTVEFVGILKRALGKITEFFQSAFINGTPIDVLIDSGSTASMIDICLFPGMAIDRRIQPYVISATGHQLEVIGKITVDIKIVGVEKKAELLLVQNSIVPCIIGLDLLVEWGTTLKLSKQGISFSIDGIHDSKSLFDVSEGSKKEAKADIKTAGTVSLQSADSVAPSTIKCL
ncbi:MAG: retropepsin-like aspartic protease [Verrucomicrobiota bacterium]